MRFPIAQKELLYNEFAKLLKAGFPISQAVDAIVEGRPPKSHQIFATSLRDSLADGAKISEAISAIPLTGITPMESKMIDAGERGGRLDTCFLELSRHFGLLRKTLSTIRSKLIYPAVLLHLGVLLPAIPRGILTQDMPGSIRSAIITLGLFYLVAIVGFFFYRTLSSTAAHSAPVDRLLGLIPVLGKFRKRLALSRFASVFRMNLLAAFTISKSLRSAGECSESGGIAELSRRLEPRVADGNPLGPQLLKEPRFPGDFARGIQTSEISGTLDDEMEMWSVRYQEDAKDSAEATSQWFPLLCYFAVLGIVAWQIISLFGAYTGMLTDMMDAI